MHPLSFLSLVPTLKVHENIKSVASKEKGDFGEITVTAYNRAKLHQASGEIFIHSINYTLFIYRIAFYV